jgi:hypothetical protein
MAANADFDIPFAASANPANPVISGGLIFRKESILGNPGILGIDDIMPLREVTMEPAEPVVIASADEKLPELIALATLAIEGSVAIIVYYLY